MNLQANINRVKRSFIIYAAIVLLLTIWNIIARADGDAAITSQVIRGGVRVAMMVYLALQLRTFRKGIWWISVIFAGILGGGALIAAVLGTIVGSVYATESTNMWLYLLQLLVPAFLLLDALYVLLKKEVKEQFVN
ncbi:MAG: hypothetical protein R3E32_10190 [Chitinophagales bacterium]